MIIFDYSAENNNCFILKHLLEDYVSTVIIDNENKKITVKYNESINKFENGKFITTKFSKIIPEKILILEEYNKFGILNKVTQYDNLIVDSITNSSITYIYNDIRQS